MNLTKNDVVDRTVELNSLKGHGKPLHYVETVPTEL